MKKSSVTTVAPLSYEGFQIRRSERGMVNLTDMWKAAGSPKNKEPAQWIRHDVTAELVEVLSLNMCPTHILKTSRGKGGATWADPRLAIAYAKFLSPAFHAWANRVVIERMEEEADPELAYSRGRDRAVRGWQKSGKSPEWIQQRIDGIDKRHELTDTLRDHGVSGPGFAACTNATYKPLLGGGAKEIKLQRGLRPNQPTRDGLDDIELLSVALSEAIAKRTIAFDKLACDRSCEQACRRSSEKVYAGVGDELRKSAARRGIAYDPNRN